MCIGNIVLLSLVSTHSQKCKFLRKMVTVYFAGQFADYIYYLNNMTITKINILYFCICVCGTFNIL